MQVALHSRIKAGHEEEYDRDHESIPDDLIEAFERAGIRDWSIWRSGRDLFHLVDCVDFSAAMTHLDGSEANERWQQFINRHLDGFARFGDGHAGLIVPPVWNLEEQVER